MADIIAAIATGHSPCAIGILRLSGSGCAQAAGQVFTPRSGAPLSDAPNRKLVLGTVHDRQGRVIDHALAVYCRAPHTYTGEDTVELHCHGGPAVLSAALDALFAAGARQAGPGEFTKRAFLNGQMDLTQAEAVIDLIDAETADAAANAAGQVGGTLLRRLNPLYDALADLCSHFHAVLDYPDEDIAPFQLAAYRQTLDDTAAQLRQILRSFDRGRFLKTGVKAAILGRPNVGKSSLLNALAGFDRVIVTEIAGTTRDTVEQTVKLGGTVLRLLDTAGIRETGDQIEAMGVLRARQAAEAADLALFVCDGSQPLTKEDRDAMEAAASAPRAIGLINQCDKGRVVEPGELPFPTVLCISARTGMGLDELEQAVDMLFGGTQVCDGSILTNARQAGAVERATQHLAHGIAALDGGLTPDAVLLDVESAMEAMGEITGRTVREDITNRIFQRFCVGK